MRKIYLLFFILLISCSSGVSRIYICGDHPCKNKKEVDDYFANNISLEVYVVDKSELKKKNQDLVKLNIYKETNEKKKKKELSFLKKRKNKIYQSKQVPKKIKLKVETDNKKDIQNDKNKETNFVYKNQKSTKIVHMCKNYEECDIDVISKKIIDLGEDKDFPKVNF